MTHIVETHRSSLSRNENSQLFFHFSVDNAKEGYVVNPVCARDASFIGGADGVMESDSSLKGK